MGKTRINEKAGKKKKMKKLTISVRKCAGCSYCKLNCPRDAIIVEDGIARKTRACNFCGSCVWVCPVQAITLH